MNDTRTSTLECPLCGETQSLVIQTPQTPKMCTCCPHKLVTNPQATQCTCGHSFRFQVHTLVTYVTTPEHLN